MKHLGKFGVDILLLGGAVALSAVLGMVLSGKAFSNYRVVGHVHIFLDPSSKEIVIDPPVEKLPLSYDLVSFHLVVDFTPLSGTDYQNLFQTDNWDNGIRLEVSSRCDVALIANALGNPLSIPFRLSRSRGFQRLKANSLVQPIVTLLPQCEFARPFNLAVTYNENGMFKGILNCEILEEYKIQNLSPQFKIFKFKNGFNGERPFSGEVRKFDIEAQFLGFDTKLYFFKGLMSLLSLAGIFCIFLQIFRKNFFIAGATK